MPPVKWTVAKMTPKIIKWWIGEKEGRCKTTDCCVGFAAALPFGLGLGVTMPV